jgi:DNA gyrase subunit A
MGRTAMGVRGIRLRAGDFVIGAVRAHPGSTLLTITERGYGKRTPIEEYIRGTGEPQHRGGYGLRNYNITDKTGPAAAIKVARDSDDILIISDDGTIIRMPVTDVNIYGRAAQGVRVMRLNEDAKVISLSRAEAESDEEEEVLTDAEEGAVTPDATEDTEA